MSSSCAVHAAPCYEAQRLISARGRLGRLCSYCFRVVLPTGGRLPEGQGWWTHEPSVEEEFVFAAADLAERQE